MESKDAQIVEGVKCCTTEAICMGFGAVLLLYVLFKLVVWIMFRPPKSNAPHAREYDVIVVGASIAGPVAAKLFSEQGRRVLVIERDMKRPDRIVGELLQPGGIEALKEVGMEHCATEIGMPCKGYAVYNDDRWLTLPYEKDWRGVSFHFGDFVENLRKVMKQIKNNVTIVEATATDLLHDQSVCYGVKYRTPQGEEREVTSHLVCLCDGGGSKFRCISNFSGVKPASFFVGVIVKGIKMPFEQHGHVVLGRTGPILSYRLDDDEVRLLIDYPGQKLPAQKELHKWLTEEIEPQLPASYRDSFKRTIANPDNIKSMPTAWFKPLFPRLRGVVGLGDHSNQRHPLTGGGMTVVFRDVINLAKKLKPLKSFENLDELQSVLLDYMRNRCDHSSCINILSWALYYVFGGPIAMRRACFQYFDLGGDAVSGPMALLSGMNTSIQFLLYHYVRVMLYGAYLVIAGKGFFMAMLFFVSPWRWFEAAHLLLYSIYIFGPVAKYELFSVWHYIYPHFGWKDSRR